MVYIFLLDWGRLCLGKKNTIACSLSISHKGVLEGLGATMFRTNLRMVVSVDWYFFLHELWEGHKLQWLDLLAFLGRARYSRVYLVLVVVLDISNARYGLIGLAI